MNIFIEDLNKPKHFKNAFSSKFKTLKSDRAIETNRVQHFWDRALTFENRHLISHSELVRLFWALFFFYLPVILLLNTMCVIMLSAKEICGDIMRNVTHESKRSLTFALSDKRTNSSFFGSFVNVRVINWREIVFFATAIDEINAIKCVFHTFKLTSKCKNFDSQKQSNHWFYESTKK